MVGSLIFVKKGFIIERNLKHGDTKEIFERNLRRIMHERNMTYKYMNSTIDKDNLYIPRKPHRKPHPSFKTLLSFL